MVKVFITGGNGFIGREVALALRRAGHDVTALVRRKEQGVSLQKEEVNYVLGELGATIDEKTFTAPVTEADVIIDTVMLHGDKPWASGDALREFVVAIAKKTGTRKRLIYTSGLLVYGNQPGKILTEEDKAISPLVGGRIASENATIALKEHVDGIVIRPGFVYGKSGGQFPPTFFQTNAKGEIDIWGNADRYVPWVHIIDLANAYVLASEAHRSLVSGEIFNLADSTRQTFRQTLESFTTIAGKPGAKVNVYPVPKEIKSQFDFFAHIMDASIVVSSAKIERVLGWKTRFGPLSDEAPKFWKAIQAHQSDAPAKKD